MIRSTLKYLLFCLFFLSLPSLVFSGIPQKSNLFFTCSICINTMYLDDEKNTQFNDPTIRVYPNPCHEFVYIDIYNTNITNEIDVQIVDICGQVVFSKTINPKHNEHINLKVSLSEVERGIFFVMVKGGEKDITQKLIIQ